MKLVTAFLLLAGLSGCSQPRYFDEEETAEHYATIANFGVVALLPTKFAVSNGQEEDGYIKQQTIAISYGEFDEEWADQKRYTVLESATYRAGAWRFYIPNIKGYIPQSISIDLDYNKADGTQSTIAVATWFNFSKCDKGKKQVDIVGLEYGEPDNQAARFDATEMPGFCLVQGVNDHMPRGL